MRTLLLIIITVAPLSSHSAILKCVVDKKFSAMSDFVYSAKKLKEQKPSVLIDTDRNIVSRCSFIERLGKVTCDDYEADYVSVARGFVDIKKYYYFNGQFDVQIFDGNRFIENNGRGYIASGKCY